MIGTIDELLKTFHKELEAQQLRKAKNRRFSPELKQATVSLIQKQGLSRQQVAQALGVSSWTIADWLKTQERPPAKVPLYLAKRDESVFAPVRLKVQDHSTLPPSSGHIIINTPSGATIHIPL